MQRRIARRTDQATGTRRCVCWLYVRRSSRWREAKALMAAAHSSVDGTPIEAAASMKSFVRKGRRHAASGRRRRAQRRGGLARIDPLRRDPCVRHRPRCQPVARATAEGQLAFVGHVLAENRHGLGVRAPATRRPGDRPGGARAIARAPRPSSDLRHGTARHGTARPDRAVVQPLRSHHPNCCAARDPQRAHEPHVSAACWRGRTPEPCPPT